LTGTNTFIPLPPNGNNDPACAGIALHNFFLILQLRQRSYMRNHAATQGR